MNLATRRNHMIAECGSVPSPLGTASGPTDMNIMRAFHGLTELAATMHGGRPSDYNTPITWGCAAAAVRMQDDMERLMREHREYARLRVAIAAARMTYAMQSAAVR